MTNDTLSIVIAVVVWGILLSTSVGQAIIQVLVSVNSVGS